MFMSLPCFYFLFLLTSRCSFYNVDTNLWLYVLQISSPIKLSVQFIEGIF